MRLEEIFTSPEYKNCQEKKFTKFLHLAPFLY